MGIHAITGLMARRMLINFRINPAVAKSLLPSGVRPSLIRGHAIAGLCLVKLAHMRPAGAPHWLPGTTSENVAVRMGVEWGPPSEPQHAVLIFRRDSASVLNTLIAGRLFPGPVNRARIITHDRDGDIRIAVRGPGQSIDVAAHEGGSIPRGSAFANTDEATHFFRGGERGYSPARRPGMWDGLALQLEKWSLAPITVGVVRSTFIAALNNKSPGSAEFDSAFITRNIPHTWTALPPLQLGEAPVLPDGPAVPNRAPHRRRLTSIVQPDFILH